jgi:hypothetical protein
MPDGGTNMEYVARLWKAFGIGGASRLADLVPDDWYWRRGRSA